MHFRTYYGEMWQLFNKLYKKCFSGEQLNNIIHYWKLQVMCNVLYFFWIMTLILPVQLFTYSEVRILLLWTPMLWSKPSTILLFLNDLLHSLNFLQGQKIDVLLLHHRTASTFCFCKCIRCLKTDHKWNRKAQLFMSIQHVSL